METYFKLLQIFSETKSIIYPQTYIIVKQTNTKIYKQNKKYWKEIYNENLSQGINPKQNIVLHIYIFIEGISKSISKHQFYEDSFLSVSM